MSAVGATLIARPIVVALAPGFGHDAIPRGLLVAVFVGAVLSCLVKALVDPADRKLWLVLGLGLAGWSAQAYYVLSPDAALSFPSPVDLAALGFYVCALLFVILLALSEIGPQPLSVKLDGLLGGLVLADLGAVFVLAQAQAGSGADSQTLYGQLSYAVADLFVLGFVATLLLIPAMRANQSHRLWLLIGAFALLATGDSIYLRAVAFGDLGSSAVVASLWAAGPLLLAAIPWTTRRPAREFARRSAIPLAIPVGSVAIALAILAVEALRPDSTTEFAVVVALVVLVLGTARLVASMKENVRLGAESIREASRSMAIADSVDEGIFIVDPMGLLTSINPAALRLLGYRSERELIGHDHHEAFHHTRADGTAYPIEDCPLPTVIETGQPIHIDEEVFWRKDGTALPVSLSASPIEWSEGTGKVVAFGDITAQMAEREHLRSQASQVVWFDRIREALEQGRLVLYGQPILDLTSRAVAGHELLLRMLSPTGEVIAPGEFLPTAEKYGLIAEIDHWVISEALKLAAAGSRVAVNISGASVGRLEVLAHIERELTRTGAPAENLTFELTETAIMLDPGAGRRFAERLVALGCSLSIDDFGTGYASLTYLRQLPVSEVKIDVQFVRDMASSEKDQKVVRAVVQIARSLGKTTVAEGVEDERTLELLRDYGVDYAQGYYIGRPEPFAPAAPKPSDALPHADRQSQAASASMSRQLRDDASRPEAVDKPVADAAAELTYGELAEARDVAAGLRDHDADVRDLEYERNEKAVLAAEESKLHALLAASKEARRRAAADRASADDVAAGNGDRAPEREEQNLATATEISESTNKALAESSQDARDHSAADRAASRADRREAARDRDEAGTEGERAAADEPTGEDG